MLDGTQTDKITPVFLTKEISQMLGISEGYLRKWCLALEKFDYHFTKVSDPKSNREYRTFTSKDIKALVHFQKLMKEMGYTKESAARTVAKLIKDNDWIAGGTSDNPDKEQTLLVTRDHTLMEREINSELLRTMVREEREYMQTQLLELQNEIVSTKNELHLLREQLSTYHTHHEVLLQERDQRLLESIRLLQEQKQLAASHEKKPWWRFW
ncbi:DUF3967 domain-containing protein [Bacillus cereus]|uniref:DUF3967 domain-containing protein n=1 Tax=Bacillus cereus TaxID=1396 RepID=UPI0018F595E2|nr:DUF3967 domain-containing protein [Bacillus cereus]MBJ8025160.1 DUF3967 domain-containing protein [Bacillus cereus]MBJ8037618.1 DUF3967 domain-containing protein [Bacillus cereus]